jgi:hypothetical protein
MDANVTYFLQNFNWDARPETALQNVELMHSLVRSWIVWGYRLAVSFMQAVGNEKRFAKCEREGWNDGICMSITCKTMGEL